MRATLSFVCLVGIVIISTVSSNPLKRYISRQEDANIREIMELVNQPIILERDQPIDFFWKWGMDPNKRLTHFAWSDCGNSSSKVKMNDLRVTPDPVVVPGPVNVAMNLSITDDFPDSISGDVVLKKKVGPIHIEIPCIDNVGSCHYDDLCDLLAKIPSCPEPMIEHNIPCKCPFKKGNYFLPSSEFSIPKVSIPSGDYTAELNLNRKGTFMGCLQVDLSIKRQEELFLSPFFH